MLLPSPLLDCLCLCIISGASAPSIRTPSLLRRAVPVAVPVAHTVTAPAAAGENPVEVALRYARGLIHHAEAAPSTAGVSEAVVVAAPVQLSESPLLRA